MGNNSFRLEWAIPKGKFEISLKDRIFLMGSCFSENIGLSLLKYKFQSLQNPFGIVFNPASIKLGIDCLFSQKVFQQEDLLFHDEIFLSLQHHSSFSNMDSEACLDGINSTLIEARNFIKKADVFIFTPGTALAYKYRKNSEWVANCHKIPAKEFERSFLNVPDCIAAFESVIENIEKTNPKANILFTISPVRHWKEGIPDNQKSKSILHLAIRSIVESRGNCDYFPSYEIMMDDLRDYRFYKPDLIHPNKTAIDYIWNKFAETYFTQESMDFIDEISKLQSSLNHRPRFPKSPNHQMFLMNLKAQIANLELTYPEMNFSAEQESLKQGLVPPVA